MTDPRRTIHRRSTVDDDAPATMTSCPNCERWDLEAEPDRYCDVCKSPPPPRQVTGPVRDAWMVDHPEVAAASEHPSETRNRP